MSIHDFVRSLPPETVRHLVEMAESGELQTLLHEVWRKEQAKRDAVAFMAEEIRRRVVRPMRKMSLPLRQG